MKRMKKKVVAMVTLAMFMMTLLPMAAFAAVPNSDVDADRSSVKITNEAGNEVSVADVNEKINLEVVVRNTNGVEVDPEGLVAVWAEDEAGNVVSNVSFEDCGTAKLDNGIAGFDSVGTDNFKTIKFAKAGKYTIHAGVSNVADAEWGKVDIYHRDDITEFVTVPTVEVNAFDAKTIDFANVDSVDHDKDEAVLENALAGFDFNGTAVYTVTGTLKNEKGNTMNGVEVALSSNKDALALEDETVTTDGAGQFKIKFTMSEKTNATITVEAAGLEYTVYVNAADSTAENIATVEEGGYVQATNDSKWANNRYFNDAVQFEITDKNGNVLEGAEAIKGEPATETAGQGHANYLKIEEQPGNSTLVPADLSLVWNDGAYTLVLNGRDSEVAPSKKLVAGDYTVKVALKSGDNAVASFKVAKFGDVEDVVVDTYAKTANSDNSTYVEVEDEIALGDDLGLKAKYVDENGLKISADKVVLGADGKAIATEYGHKYSNEYYEYALQANTVANEALLGTVIKVTAFDQNEKKLVEKELTVVDAYDTYSLAFDATEGEINKDNKVGVTVVDKDDNVAKKVNGDVYAYVAKQSNEDAKVSVDVKGVEAKKGEFDIKVSSNKATTADIVVGVKADNGAIYAGTLSYTFGEEDIPAGTSVVMTLGSTEMIINNEVVDMKDAAPFAQNNRTYVPFRALGEALGAQVEYDKDAKTVTYELGSTKIVMTLDSKTYTVNGAEKTMDVAPFAKDNRTYVPVRFVGEGLGFTVTGLTNANGQYVAVAFTK